MSEILNASISLPVAAAKQMEVVKKAMDWALMHGLIVNSTDKSCGDSFKLLPFVLLPTKFPRREFEKAVRLQPIFNELIHLVAHDTEFLRQTLANTIKADEFTGNLFKIFERILAEGGPTQPLSLGIFRSDYITHAKESNSIKQVEINTMSSGGAPRATLLHKLHSFVLTEFGHSDKVENLPKNNALVGLSEALIKAWRMTKRKDAGILFVIHNVVRSICDPRLIEFHIRESCPEIKVTCKTLTQIHNEATLGPNLELMVNGEEYSVVYFRTGFTPAHHPSQNEWDARYLIEKSAAIKCPSIQYQLTGTKKVQQVLAMPGVLKRFFTDETKIQMVIDTFIGLYSMDADTKEGADAFAMVLKDPTDFVMKPQRDGGGHNVFGVDIPPTLKEMSAEERSAWILMERIYPSQMQAYFIRSELAHASEGTLKPEGVIAELGIFGTIIGDKDKIIHNDECGHLMRSKLDHSNECGVNAGFGAFDSPYLYDD